MRTLSNINKLAAMIFMFAAMVAVTTTNRSLKQLDFASFFPLRPPLPPFICANGSACKLSQTCVNNFCLDNGGPPLTANAFTSSCGAGPPCPIGAICLGGQCVITTGGSRSFAFTSSCGAGPPCPIGAICLGGQCVITTGGSRSFP